MPQAAQDAASAPGAPSPIHYDVTALQMPIYFNKEGDHDHNGMMYALSINVDLLKYIRALAEDEDPTPHKDAAKAVADRLGMPFPEDKQQARQPHPLVRPLVLRANKTRRLRVTLHNEVEDRWVGLHLVAGGYDVKRHDGSEVGANGPSLAEPGGVYDYEWACDDEGVFPFHDGGSYSGGEDGTNVHGLFGALVVEPEHAIWRDPVTGHSSLDGQLDGLYLDIIPGGEAPPKDFPESGTTLPDHEWGDPKERHEFDEEDHREFVIFFHDEPEFLPPHGELELDPCTAHDAGPGGGAGHGGHGGAGGVLPIMPVSYRAEPMVNRERTLWELVRKGHQLKRPVLNEEQHHSSWMFGDPATPILKAYIGDPVRIRFVHAGVKETHVFHLHLYEWHAVAGDPSSPRIDAISVSPQTGHTIEPAWGAGNRHQVAGDVIWHCHLYPHFHEGMWGMFRTFETLQKGADKDQESPPINDSDEVYKDRKLDHYPDGTPIQRLWPLPGRVPPRPTPDHPGYPLYIPGEFRQKSPVPPWPLTDRPLPPDHDYRPEPTQLERQAFNGNPVPGEMFTRRRFAVGQEQEWPLGGSPKYDANGPREIEHEIAVDLTPIPYNGYGWHDKHGHIYYLTAEGRPLRTDVKRPLFFRALHGQILNLTLRNDLPLDIPGTEFDHAFPPCPARPWQGECAPHVHMVKFDPICADGASVGWNYISGPVAGKKMIYRWWLDQEFGTIFFHDHLFANYRQKHGLFGALIVEPTGAEFHHPTEKNKRIVSGLQARIRAPGRTPEWFREFCIGIGDFIPMWDRDGNPLNPPDHPGGHGDQGVMGLNYRSDPIHERLRTAPPPADMVDPALWFSSGEPYNRDPYTVRFDTFAGDPIWFRLVQGSHEEQHSFQVHGMRWQRFRVNPDSAIRNQQTFGIAEAFTFIQGESYGPGDYLYKLSSSDDLWLGCWGLIRAYNTEDGDDVTGGLEKLENPPVAAPPVSGRVREFHVRAERRRIVYRDPDLVDPFGLVYQLVKIIDPDGNEVPVRQTCIEDPAEPLVLRCREGETVRICLTNGLPPGVELRPEPFAPRVPVEERDPFSHRPERPVSSQVSMHADLVRYDVTRFDGANVGRNAVDEPQSAHPGDVVVYEWQTDRPPPSAENPNPNGGEPLGPLLLQDMADFRNHRHHGLIGALIIEPTGVTPLRVLEGAQSATDTEEAWDGPRATLITQEDGCETRVEEVVLLLQDGLRHYLRGNIHMPIPDEPPGPGENEPDHEDQGQKAFNYRSEPVGPDIGNILQGEPEGWLANPEPATPVFLVPEGSTVRLHLVGATDKPRNQSFTVHGVAWPEYRFLGQQKGPCVASESAITTGTARTFEFKVHGAGDYAYRSGILKWAVPQGLWGILRVGHT